ncbi:pyridoxamine 5'-phosphate oxidase family protein [Actinophytocola sp.]|uniref:pyridoxamine 5'-phosphate oxidase family protein n=1 Tax=Actinophytocola sp. TaxID=1872138 RepID=UPI003D6B0C47
MTPPPARTREQRRTDTLARLENDVDAWLATAGEGGPYLVPLSFRWDGTTLVVATPAASPTGRNLRAGRVRVGLGHTRDVVMIDGVVEVVIAAADVPAILGDAFAAATGFDPRTLSTPHAYFRIRPQRIQAWRESNELAGRDLMRDGSWLV